MTERFVAVGGVELCVDTIGDQAEPVVLLLGGACQSMDWWEPEFCAQIAAGGRQVIRFDARDTGRSAVSPAGAPSYTTDELVTDPIGILDALGVDATHVVGLSTGGGIAQQLACLYPDRIRSLTLVGTSAAGDLGAAVELPGMTAELAAYLDNPPAMPDPTDRDAWVDYVVGDQRRYSGPAHFDEDHTRRIATRVVERTTDLVASFTNVWSAPSGALPAPVMNEITQPTLVLHGTADPFFQYAHGEALAAAIPGARLLALDGAGHEVPPPPLWDVAVAAILDHTRAIDA